MLDVTNLKMDVSKCTGGSHGSMRKCILRNNNGFGRGVSESKVLESVRKCFKVLESIRKC